MTDRNFDRSSESPKETVSSAFATILIDEYIKDKSKLAADLKRDFSNLDKNGNGALSKEELKQVFEDKNASPQMRAESKVLLDNFESATALTGNHKAFALDFSKEGFLKGDFNKNKAFNNEFTVKDLNVLSYSASASGEEQIKSKYNGGGQILKKFAEGSIYTSLSTTVGALAIGFEGLSTVAGLTVVGGAALGLAPAAIAGASLIYGAITDARRAVSHPINKTIDNELAARRRMLESWR